MDATQKNRTVLPRRVFRSQSVEVNRLNRHNMTLSKQWYTLMWTARLIQQAFIELKLPGACETWPTAVSRQQLGFSSAWCLQLNSTFEVNIWDQTTRYSNDGD